MTDLRDKTLPEMREMEAQGVQIIFPHGEKFTLRGGMVRQLWRWYFQEKIEEQRQGR